MMKWTLRRVWSILLQKTYPTVSLCLGLLSFAMLLVACTSLPTASRVDLICFRTEPYFVVVESSATRRVFASPVFVQCFLSGFALGVSMVFSVLAIVFTREQVRRKVFRATCAPLLLAYVFSLLTETITLICVEFLGTAIELNPLYRLLPSRSLFYVYGAVFNGAFCLSLYSVMNGLTETARTEEAEELLLKISEYAAKFFAGVVFLNLLNDISVLVVSLLNILM